METLQERLQREAREKWIDKPENQSSSLVLDNIISHTISETRKEAVRVIREMQEWVNKNTTTIQWFEEITHGPEQLDVIVKHKLLDYLTTLEEALQDNK